MKTITISITVPDGADVRITQGAPGPARNERPFVPKPDPPYPGGVCPIHGTDWKLIKGGFSKTKTNADGTPKRFNGFYVCEVDGCDEKPPKEDSFTDLSEGMPF